MPNIITHTIFCEEVYKTIENKKYKQIIESHWQEYGIGTNGPDFLFFHDAFPLYKKIDPRVSKIGTRLHNEKINLFYESAIKTYRLQEDGELKDAMAAYLIGHYLHWQLDSVMHPYVFYLTGFGTKLNTLHHHRFESMMDTINLKNYRNLTIKTFKTYELCNQSEYSVDAISNIYIAAIKKCFDIDLTKEDIEKALSDWKKTQKAWHDPHKIKYSFLRFIEWVIRKPGLSGNIVLVNEDEEYDVMNVNHSAWQHPCTGEVSYESEDDLFKKALANAQIGLTYLFAALDNKAMKPLLDFIDDKTYANGISGAAIRQYQKDIYTK